MTKQESTKPKDSQLQRVKERGRSVTCPPSLPPHMFREARRRRSPIPRLPSFLPSSPFYFALCNVRRGRKEGQRALVSRRSSCFLLGPPHFLARNCLASLALSSVPAREGSGKPDPGKESVRARTHAAPSPLSSFSQAEVQEKPS